MKKRRNFDLLKSNQQFWPCGYQLLSCRWDANAGKNKTMDGNWIGWNAAHEDTIHWDIRNNGGIWMHRESGWQTISVKINWKNMNEKSGNDMGMISVRFCTWIWHPIENPELSEILYHDGYRTLFPGKSFFAEIK